MKQAFVPHDPAMHDTAPFAFGPLLLVRFVDTLALVRRFQKLSMYSPPPLPYFTTKPTGRFFFVRRARGELLVPCYPDEDRLPPLPF